MAGCVRSALDNQGESDAKAIDDGCDLVLVWRRHRAGFAFKLIFGANSIGFVDCAVGDAG